MVLVNPFRQHKSLVKGTVPRAGVEVPDRWESVNQLGRHFPYVEIRGQNRFIPKDGYCVFSGLKLIDVCAPRELLEDYQPWFRFSDGCEGLWFVSDNRIHFQGSGFAEIREAIDEYLSENKDPSILWAGKSIAIEPFIAFREFAALLEQNLGACFQGHWPRDLPNDRHRYWGRVLGQIAAMIAQESCPLQHLHFIDPTSITITTTHETSNA